MLNLDSLVASASAGSAATSQLPLVVDPLVQIITLEVLGLSGYYMFRQKMTSYRYAKGLLITVNVLFAGVMVFEFLRTAVFVPEDFVTSGFAYVYTVGGSVLILASVVVLTFLAVTVYLAPSGVGSKSTLRLLWENKIHLLLFGGFTSFIVFASVYLAVTSPFKIKQIPSVTGVILPVSAFDQSYLVMTLIVLLGFMAYPSLLLVLASRKAKDPAVGRVLRILPIVWSGIGIDILVFNGVLLEADIDATAFGYAIAAVAFGVTAVVFRRASLLTSFFEPVRPVTPGAAEFPFTERLGVASTFTEGKAILLEDDPTVAYEQAVADFARQEMTNNFIVYVFTSKGGPVYNTLRSLSGVRYYIMSARVTYPKPDENDAAQILVPASDQAVLLDLIDKTITAVAAPAKIAIIFDGISDMVLSSGFEPTYKFVKQANEATGNGRTTSLFLMTIGAHDDKVVSLIRSLFPTQLVDDANGLKVTRSQ